MKVVVCGAKFGQVYLEALAGSRFELAGVLARGSARSAAAAAHYGVPLFTSPVQVPDDVELACVVVRGGLLGGPGAALAGELLGRGLHVLQEHPLHHDELAGCLRTASRNGVVYRLNSFYAHQPPVRRFLGAARHLLARQRPRYVDAACGFQVAYALLDILGQALGGVRPWAFADPTPMPAGVRAMTELDMPFRSLDGVLAGVPLTLRVQNQMDPADPDNYAHLLHRITIGTEAGSLTLVGTHGPVVWSPRPDFPREIQSTDASPHFAGDGVVEDHLDVPSGRVLGPANAPGYREVFGSVWPHGVRNALGELAAAASAGDRSTRHGQYHLTLCRLWQDITARLGPPELLDTEPPHPFGPGDVAELELAGEQAVAS